MTCGGPVRTALITGTTSGLGKMLAATLAQSGWLVYFHGRDVGRLQEAGRLIPGGVAMCADLGSISQVRRLAAEASTITPAIDLLINNAGVGYGPPDQEREIGSDGYELRFAVNCIAPLLLSSLLAPHMAPGGRIVNVGSVNQGPFDIDDLLLEPYRGDAAYQRSKMALSAGTFSLAVDPRFSQVTMNCVHPGSRLDTPMVRISGVSPLNDLSTGVDAVLHVATAPALDGVTGAFFDGAAPARAHPQAYSAEFQSWLRRVLDREMHKTVRQ
ncbi:SDR family NAD(P)-dependent oxidoreductase [Kitasatospora phosalacinea]|uniref:SDR family NAD(P)-dependent oxidoreductase n=1 Tax=Kitasatospora phosalacinea TaxID=2065 RepID=UPI0035E0FAF8